MDDQNQDLAKQYQDILDRYSRELATTTTPAAPASEPTSVPEVEPEPQLALPENQPIQIASPPIAPIPPIETTPARSVDSVLPPVPDLPPSDFHTSPRPNNFFKYLFFLSLIVFLVVLASVVYTISKNTSQSMTDNSAPTSAPEVLPSSTPAFDKICSVNDHSYKVGESFLSADGCNTCSCTSDLTVMCTEKACEASPSVKLVPSLKPTVAPKASPTTAKTISSLFSAVNKTLATNIKTTTAKGNYFINGQYVEKNGQVLDLSKVAIDKQKISQVHDVFATFDLTDSKGGGDVGGGYSETFSSSIMDCNWYSTVTPTKSAGLSCALK